MVLAHAHPHRACMRWEEWQPSHACFGLAVTQQQPLAARRRRGGSVSGSAAHRQGHGGEVGGHLHVPVVVARVLGVGGRGTLRGKVTTLYNP